MSKETITHLNTNTLIGFTDKRGQAWHYRAEEQGAESNHYTGAIPVADVHRRLFDWVAVEGEITATATFLTPDGVTSHTTKDTRRKPIMRSDNGHILGIFMQGYRPHQYGEWLVHNVETILDADLQIGSAGILKEGAVGWVQVEMEETMGVDVKGKQAVEFRPFLTAVTSFDGSIATRYKRGAQVVVCDNTLSAAIGVKGEDEYKLKHSRNSLDKIGEARDALNIVHSTADAFAQQVQELTAQVVTDRQWAEFVKRYTFKGSSPTMRQQNATAKEAGDLNQLYGYDKRVAPWAGTAYGVLAAVNTYTHHIKTVKGATRAERNATRLVEGKVDDLDRGTLELLAKVR